MKLFELLGEREVPAASSGGRCRFRSRQAGRARSSSRVKEVPPTSDSSSLRASSRRSSASRRHLGRPAAATPRHGRLRSRSGRSAGGDRDARLSASRDLDLSRSIRCSRDRDDSILAGAGARSWRRMSERLLQKRDCSDDLGTRTQLTVNAQPGASSCSIGSSSGARLRAANVLLESRVPARLELRRVRMRDSGSRASRPRADAPLPRLALGDRAPFSFVEAASGARGRSLGPSSGRGSGARPRGLSSPPVAGSTSRDLRLRCQGGSILLVASSRTSPLAPRR